MPPLIAVGHRSLHCVVTVAITVTTLTTHLCSVISRVPQQRGTGFFIVILRIVARYVHSCPAILGVHISAEARINERIRVPEVRLVGPGGEQVGIVRTDDARKLAYDADLDLVEVAPNAKPPVCKIMDYGKFKYEQAQKARESRKNQQQTVVKEQKLRPKIDDHDYETKKGNVVRFLEKGSKVKVTIMFRGREQSRPELGFRLLDRLAQDVAEYGVVETKPKQDGRNMTMVLGPVRKGKK